MSYSSNYPKHTPSLALTDIPHSISVHQFAGRHQMLRQHSRQFVAVQLHIDQMHCQRELVHIQFSVHVHVGQLPHLAQHRVRQLRLDHLRFCTYRNEVEGRWTVTGNSLWKQQKPSSALTLPRNLPVDRIQRQENWIRSLTISGANPIHLAVARVNAFATLVAERRVLLLDSIKGTTCNNEQRRRWRRDVKPIRHRLIESRVDCLHKFTATR